MPKTSKKQFKPEKDYAAIAAARMMSPADVDSKPRFLIYSRNKKGKTTFSISAGIQHTLVLDPEQGTKEMKTKIKHPHVWPIDVWEDVDDAYMFMRFVNECRNKKCPNAPHPFTWVSVDGMTKIANMSLKYVMRMEEEKSLTRIPGMVQQRDYGKSGELIKEMLNKWHNLPVGIVFTAQERQVEPYDSEEDEDVEEGSAAYVPDLPKGVRGALNSIVDVIGRIYVVKGDDDKPERRLWVGESVMYDTGYRSDFVLPDMVRRPTIPRLIHLMRTGTLPQAKKKTTKK